MELERAFEHAINGRALLFTGAGFSRGATNLRNKPFKSGPQFANYLASEVGLPLGTPLDDASEEFAEKFGEDKLASELESEFTAKQISKTHEQLAAVAWKRIYTTNYDNVIERAYQVNGRRLKSVTMSDDIRAIPKGDTDCVHLNGFVGRVTRDTIWTEIKLTDTSYLTASLAESPWATLFREDMGIARAIFFVGYSISDLDIRRILFDTKSLTDKCFFIVGDNPSPSTLSRARRFGTVLQQGADDLAAAIVKKAASYAPAENTGPIPHCFEKFAIDSSPATLLDRSIFDLLLLGDVDPKFVWRSLHGGQRYVLDREAVGECLKYIETGVRAVVIHSSLGNGKSLVLEELKCRASEKDYAVYSLVKPGNTLFEELESALQDTKNHIIFIDNYPEWMEVLRFYSRHATARSSIELAARTSHHDVLVDRISEIIRVPDMKEVAVDHLSKDEMVWISKFFDEYGLWGEQSAWMPNEKARYLSRVCRGEWHAVLLKLFESPQILAKLNRIFDDLNKKQNYYEVLIALLILSVLDRVPSLDMLLDLAGSRILETGFKRDPAIGEVVDFKSGQVKLRSPVVGQFILKRIADPNITVKALISLARSTHKIAAESRYYFDLLRAFARFTNLQSLLPETGRMNACLHYYETIKTLEFYQTDPLFWLQYAMACLVFEDFDRARKYFEAAYSYAKKRGSFDSYQIDNHYARFLLMRAIHSRDASNCMVDFRSARKIILNQMQNERMNYPYRVATVIANFYEAFAPSLSDEYRSEIARTAQSIADRIEKLPEVQQRNRIVVESWEAMQRVLQDRK